MKDLEAATVKICQLKGEAMGMQCMLNAILRSLPRQALVQTLIEFATEAETARVVLLNSERVGEHVIDGFETYIQQVKTIHHQGI